MDIIDKGNNDYLYDMLQDEKAACHYLQIALNAYQYDGNRQALCNAIRNTIKSRDTLTVFGLKTGISREHLSYVLSGRCNFRIDTAMKIFKGLDLHLYIGLRK